MSERKRILTGVRPTGPLHIGHYAGALSTWLALQGE
jgi:tryptophanyl-tRNA synthetase